jgi:hypothetical protein
MSLSVRFDRLLWLIGVLLALMACQPQATSWQVYRVPADVDMYTLQGLELTEEVRFVEGEPTLFLQLAVTAPVTIDTIEAHYTYYDYSGTLSSDRRAELEAQADSLNADTARESLRVPLQTRYTPTGGEHDVIGSYLLPLGQPDPAKLIGYRVLVTLDDPADTFANGKLIRVDNGTVYRPRD